MIFFMNSIKKKYFILLFYFFSSCSINSGFYFYNMDGKELSFKNNEKYNNKTVRLYFDRNEIEKDFVEINVIASNYHFYGDFYFDENFMSTLNKRVSLLDADALIFEKDLSRYSFYKKDYIYFTAIKFR